MKLILINFMLLSTVEQMQVNLVSGLENIVLQNREKGKQ